MIFTYKLPNPSQIGYLEPEDQRDIIERETRRGLLNQIYDKYLKDVKVDKMVDEDGAVYYQTCCDCVVIPLHVYSEEDEDA